MPELDKEEVVEKLIKIAKKSLKPDKSTENQPVQVKWRFELSSKNLRTIIFILVISIIFSGFYWWNTKIKFNDEPALIIPASENIDETNQPNTAISEVVVYVSGDVVNTGVFKLPSGSRVIDALEKAGGLAKNGNIGDNNLARLISDGEQIDFRKSSGTNLRKSNNGAKQSNGCINLNTATLSELDLLPGVGPVLAQRIMDWKESNGEFKSVEQLSEVSGIGKSKYSTISAKSCV
jgi:competence protein ComEA